MCNDILVFDNKVSVFHNYPCVQAIMICSWLSFISLMATLSEIGLSTNGENAQPISYPGKVTGKCHTSRTEKYGKNFTYIFKFPWKKIYCVSIEIHWWLPPRVQSTLGQHWFQFLFWFWIGGEPLHEPILTNMSDVWRHMALLGHNWLIHWPLWDLSGFLYVIVKVSLVIAGWVIAYEITPVVYRELSLNLTDDESALIQVKICWRQAASHYLSLCWPRSVSPHAVTRHTGPDNKVHEAYMGPTWVLSAPDGPHVGSMNLAIRGGGGGVMVQHIICMQLISHAQKYDFHRFEKDPFKSLNLVEQFNIVCVAHFQTTLSECSYHKYCHCRFWIKMRTFSCKQCPKCDMRTTIYISVKHLAKCKRIVTARCHCNHYGDVIMDAIASQITSLFRRRSKKTSKLRVTGLCAGNSPGTGEFSAQMASNAENVSIWWRHHDNPVMGVYILSWFDRKVPCYSGTARYWH